MAFKKKKKKIVLGTVTTMFIVTLATMILSTVLSKIGLQAEKTSLVGENLIVSFTNVKNFLTIDGMQYLFNNVILNFQMFEAIALMIVSLLSFGILEVSGLLQMVSTPLKRLSSKGITILIVLLSFISTFFGEYSFVIMLPFAGVLYHTLGKNSMLGVITAFLGITLGYGSGLIFNYDQVSLGILTQLAATMEVDKNYVFSSFSSSIIMTASLLLFVPIVSTLIESQIAPYFEKPVIVNNEKNHSKKAFLYSMLSLIILIVMVIFMIVPRGILLDNTQTSYFNQLFSSNAPFRNGIIIILAVLIIVPSYIYGKLSKNIETSTGITDSLAIGLQDCGYLLMISFFGSIMISVFEWTGIGELFVCKIIEILSKFQISGILLIAIFFALVVIMTFLVPSTLTKWSLMSPIAVPLFMRANITPDFTQFIFQVADGVGKSISIFFPYFLIMLGLMHKYNSEDMKIGMGSIIKRIMPVVLITAIFWIFFFIIWYLAGFPVGISEYATL